MLTEHSVAAIREYGVSSFALSGGVASNSALRASIMDACERENVRFYCPSKVFCTDNAAMIGVAAYHEYTKGNFADYTLNAVPNLAL